MTFLTVLFTRYTASMSIEPLKILLRENRKTEAFYKNYISLAGGDLCVIIIEMDNYNQ